MRNKMSVDLKKVYRLLDKQERQLKLKIQMMTLCLYQVIEKCNKRIRYASIKN